MPKKRRDFAAFIDPPSPFSPLSEWEAFLESMERIEGDWDNVRELIEEARATIAERKAESEL